MAIYTVDTNADIVDAGDGVLSLREALALADATEAADTILFADAVQGRTIVLAGSQLTVNSDVTIDGGSGVTHRRRRAEPGAAGAGRRRRDVTLAHLTVTGGRTTGDYDGGGGIRADSYTTLTLDHATVSGNSTAG